MCPYGRTSLRPDIHVTLQEVVSDIIEMSIYSANGHKHSWLLPWDKINARTIINFLYWKRNRRLEKTFHNFRRNEVELQVRICNLIKKLFSEAVCLPFYSILRVIIIFHTCAIILFYFVFFQPLHPFLHLHLFNLISLLHLTLQQPKKVQKDFYHLLSCKPFIPLST